MWLIVKRLSLGLFLIALTSSLLLFSDWKSRTASRKQAAAQQEQRKVFQVALLQNASQPILDDGARGIIDGLAARGYRDGDGIELKKYNAEGDMPTINAIAKEITDGRFDLVITISTPCLQAVANANKAGKTKHVFALVTDPYGAGVGINRTNHLDHPAHLVGYGTMQPVESCFRIARQMRPELKTVGVVWNPSEANSVAQNAIAKKVCAAMGLTLLETTVDNSTGVGEAASAVVARGSEAVWISGDSTVLVAAEAVVQAARKNRIPVFTVIPPTVDKGALFDVGANYYEVGHIAGDLAADVLDGKDMKTIPVENLVPEMLTLNKVALKELRDTWRIPDELLAKADTITTETGKEVRKKAVAATTKPVSHKPLAKKWRIHLVEFIQVVDVEEAEKGILDGLKLAGLVEGRDYEVKISNAHGDMATVSSLIDAAVTDQADMIITLSTPTLQAALRRANGIPVIFAYCSNGIIAGAGESETKHLPNVTGVQMVAAYSDLFAAIKECLPRARTIGTLFVPSELNMVYNKDKMIAEAKKVGLEVIALGAETSVEVPDAAAALCNRPIDAICQIPGNLTVASFPSIVKAAQNAKKPIFASQTSQAKGGAAVVAARDNHDASVQAAALAARVMRGEKPVNLPFENYSTSKLIVNPEGAKACGLTLPPDLIKRAAEVIR